MFIRLAVLSVLLLLGAGGASAQSFNCNLARTADEVLICQDDRLAALDERLSTVYARLRNSLVGAELRDLEAEQLAWLGARRRCGRDPGCIAASYRTRIRELQAW
jgi:uncharacterized protein